MSKAPTEPTTKFWHPLSIWTVLLVFLLCEIPWIALFLVLREGLELGVPMWPAFGFSGATGVIVVGWYAKQRRMATQEAGDAS